MTKHSLFANQRLSEDTAFGRGNFPYQPPPENEGSLSAKELALQKIQKQRRNQQQLESLQETAVEEQKMEDDANENNNNNNTPEAAAAQYPHDQATEEYGFRAQLDALAKALFGNCGNLLEAACLRTGDAAPYGNNHNRAPMAAQPQPNGPNGPYPPQQQQQRPPPLPGSGADGLPYGETADIGQYHNYPAQQQPHPHYAYPPEPPPLSIADELRQLAAKAGMPFPMMPSRRGEAVPKFLGEDALMEDSDDNISAISAHTLEEMVRKQHPSSQTNKGMLHPLCQPAAQQQQLSSSSLNTGSPNNHHSNKTQLTTISQQQQHQPLHYHHTDHTQRRNGGPVKQYSSSSYQSSSRESGEWSHEGATSSSLGDIVAVVGDSMHHGNGDNDPPSPTRTGSSSSGGGAQPSQRDHRSMEV